MPLLATAPAEYRCQPGYKTLGSRLLTSGPVLPFALDSQFPWVFRGNPL